MPVNIVLIGPPGSGKGTQAVRLAARYSVPHISTGDILREAVRSGSPLGKEVAGIIARGSLVGDQLIADLVRDRLAQPDAVAGSILDGFPRTVVQARVLDDIMDGVPPLVVLIDVPDDAIVQRLSSRRVCQSCRLTQSVSDGADGQGESCPYCGGRLIRRDDDEPETVRHRLSTYAAASAPVIEFYRLRPGFISIDGLQPPDQVTAAMVSEIDRRLRGA
jgi:adenylate kinase